MQAFKIGLVVEPSNDLFSVQFGRFYRNASEVTAPGILHRMIAKTVMHRVIVDVKNHLFQISFIFNDLSFKRPFKKAAVATVAFVESLCIRIKQLRKLQ